MNSLAGTAVQPCPYAAAITAIDAFIRTLRQGRSPSHMLARVDQFLALQTTLDAAERALSTGPFPPEPLRSNYRGRLHTLSFELHRLEPLLQQEQARVSHQLHKSTTRRAWLQTLSTTQ